MVYWQYGKEYTRDNGEKMIKIGILTYHRSINYGAVIQAYALSCRISEIADVQVEIIDYMSKKMDIYYKLFTIYRGKNGLLRLGDRITMYKAFSNSMINLPLTKDRLISDNIFQFFNFIKDRYDVIVVGSDAVWNYEKRGLPNPYFLTGKTNARKVSFAASCNGIHYDSLNSEKLAILRDAFSCFEYIGVRDILTKRVVADAMGFEKAVHNCDPTLLLDFEKDGLGEKFVDRLKEKLVKKYGLDSKGKYIGLMLSNLNGDLEKTLVEKLKQRYRNDYQIVSIYSYCRYADIPYLADLTPFECSRIFSLFKITFSKYFHGTLLSLMNRTPVIALSAENHIEGIPAKVEDVLIRLDLMDMFWPATNSTDIQWDALMEIVDSLIQCSPIERINTGIKKERSTADSFFEFLRSI